MTVPVRMCLACRRRAAQSALVRLAVVGKAVAIDSQARMPGRGAYICRRRSCLEAALAHEGQRLRRALRLGRTGPTVDTARLTAQAQQSGVVA